LCVFFGSYIAERWMQNKLLTRHDLTGKIVFLTKGSNFAECRPKYGRRMTTKKISKKGVSKRGHKGQRTLEIKI